MCRLCLSKLGPEISTLQEPGWPHLHRCEEQEGKWFGEGCEAGGPLGWMGPFKHSTFPWLFSVPQVHTLPSTFNEEQRYQRHWLTRGSWWKKYHNSIEILGSHSYMVLVDCYGLPWWDTSFIFSNSPGSGGKALEKCSKVGCSSKICSLSKLENPWPGKRPMYNNKTVTDRH